MDLLPEKLLSCSSFFFWMKTLIISHRRVTNIMEGTLKMPGSCIKTSVVKCLFDYDNLSWLLIWSINNQQQKHQYWVDHQVEDLSYKYPTLPNCIHFAKCPLSCWTFVVARLGYLIHKDKIFHKIWTLIFIHLPPFTGDERARCTRTIF